MATGGLYGNTSDAAVIATPSAESTSLYGGTPSFGGTYFQWLVFQVSATAPSTPTGGSWNFSTNTGTPPTGWSLNVPSAPTNPVWVSWAIVSSKSGSSLTWSTPGVFTQSTAGTVTSVAVSGGTTGLTTSGGPVTTSGTITLAGTLALANGGSGATTAQGGMNAFAGSVTSGSYLRGNGTNVVMSAIQAGDVPTLNQNTTGTAANITATSNSTLTTLSALSLPGSQVTGNITGNAANVTGTVAIANGGTGATSAAAALTSLGAYPASNPNGYTSNTGTVTSIAVSGGTTGLTTSGGPVTGSGTITLAGTLAVANGGTGATTANAGLNALLPSQTSNSGKVLSTDGTNTSWIAVGGSGTVTSVGGTGTVNGLTLTGTVTTSGSLTLGGTLSGVANSALTNSAITFGSTSQALGSTVSALNGVSIGSTTRSTGDFTTLSGNAVTSTTPVLSFNASNSIATFGSTTANSFNQLVIQNLSSSAGASTNYVLSNNLGTDSTYYGEFGMNASTYASTTYTDFFSMNNGVYFSAHDGDVTMGSGNGYKTYLAWGTSGQSAHVINASGALGLSTNLGTTSATTGTTGYGTSGQMLVSAGSGAAVAWSSTPRVLPRVSTTTSSATPTINTDNVDQYGLTAQAVDITSFTTNLSGTPTNGQKLWIYIVGTAARAITWGSSFESSTATLPTTTVTTNRLDVGFVWNVATSKWRCVAVA